MTAFGLVTPAGLAIVAVAVLLAAISKGGFDGGLGMLAVPLMSLVMPPAEAAAIMLPVLLAMDAFSLWAWRRSWDRRIVWMMLPAAVVGIALGGLAFGHLSDDLVRLVLGVIAVVFSLNWFNARRLAGTAPPAAALHHTAKARVCGFLGGFTSTLAHAGGPPVNFYLLPLRMERTMFVGTIVYLFAAINLAKVPAYALAGLFDASRLELAAMLVPLAALGVWLGLKLNRRVNDRQFYIVCYGAMLLTGLKLIYDGLA